MGPFYPALLILSVRRGVYSTQEMTERRCKVAQQHWFEICVSLDSKCRETVRKFSRLFTRQRIPGNGEVYTHSPLFIAKSAQRLNLSRFLSIKPSERALFFPHDEAQKRMGLLDSEKKKYSDRACFSVAQDSTRKSDRPNKPRRAMLS